MPLDVVPVSREWLARAQAVLTEVEAQYQRKQQNLREMGGNPDARKGDMICHVPWALLIALFEE